MELKTCKESVDRMSLIKTVCVHSVNLFKEKTDQGKNQIKLDVSY